MVVQPSHAHLGLHKCKSFSLYLIVVARSTVQLTLLHSVRSDRATHWRDSLLPLIRPCSYAIQRLISFGGFLTHRESATLQHFLIECTDTSCILLAGQSTQVMQGNNHATNLQVLPCSRELYLVYDVYNRNEHTLNIRGIGRLRRSNQILCDGGEASSFQCQAVCLQHNNRVITRVPVLEGTQWQVPS